MVASQYHGDGRGGERGEAATLESHLEQVGQGEPVLEVDLRHYPEREMEFERKLDLSIADAREFAAALAHLCDLADGEAG